MGHSYGTFVLSRVIQQHRHTVQSMVRALYALHVHPYSGVSRIVMAANMDVTISAMLRSTCCVVCLGPKHPIAHYV